MVDNILEKAVRFGVVVTVVAVVYPLYAVAAIGAIITEKKSPPPIRPEWKGFRLPALP